MVQVAVAINGRTYRVSCDEGQEPRVMELARRVDEKVVDLVQQVGQVGEMQLLVMTALLLADELDDTRGRLQALQAAGADDDAAAVAVLEDCAERLESIAARLEAV